MIRPELTLLHQGLALPHLVFSPVVSTQLLKLCTMEVPPIPIIHHTPPDIWGELLFVCFEAGVWINRLSDRRDVFNQVCITTIWVRCVITLYEKCTYASKHLSMLEFWEDSSVA